MAPSWEKCRKVLEAVQDAGERERGCDQGPPRERSAKDHGAEGGGGEEAAKGGEHRGGEQRQGGGYQGF